MQAEWKLHHYLFIDSLSWFMYACEMSVCVCASVFASDNFQSVHTQDYTNNLQSLTYVFVPCRIVLYEWANGKEHNGTIWTVAQQHSIRATLTAISKATNCTNTITCSSTWQSHLHLQMIISSSSSSSLHGLDYQNIRLMDRSMHRCFE